MQSRRGRRRKIDAEELSLFGEVLEDIFKRGDLVQKEVATAGELPDTTLSQMKFGLRLTRNNVQKVIEGLIRVRYLNRDNLELTANRLLQLAAEEPLNRNYKRDAELIRLVDKLPIKPKDVKRTPTNRSSFFNQNHIIIAIPAIECVICHEGDYNYKIQKVVIK